MNLEEKQKRLETLDKSVQKLKENQKLIMQCLTSDIGNGLEEKDLKVVRWAYNQKFKMFQHEKLILNKKKIIQ
jgi:hypothetical protein